MAKYEKPRSGYGTDYSSYGSYGTDYGYETGHSRTLADYIVLIRERIWYIVIIFMVVAAGTMVYTFRKTKIYTASALIEIYRADPEPMVTRGQVDLENIVSSEDLNTEINLLRSQRLVQAVADRLQGEDRRAFMSPYDNAVSFSGKASVEEVLAQNRSVSPVRMSLNVVIGYSHPNPVMAAKIANLFAEEYVSLTLNRGLERKIKAVDDLRREAESTKREVERLESQLAEYRKRFNAVSLDKSENVAIGELQNHKQRYNAILAAYKQSETQMKLIEEYEAKDLPLWELDFITQRSLVSSLLARRSNAMINIATLAKRYKEKHPLMLEAQENLDQINRELEAAVATAKAMVAAQFDEIQMNLVQAEQQVADTEKELLELAELRTGYSSIEREFKVAQAGYLELISNLAAREQETNWKEPQGEIIDKAGTPSEPSSPNVPLNLAAGMVGGLMLGFGFALGLAYLDNRVKSAYDVEEVVGLPLLGIVPKMDRRLTSPERARAVFSNLDRKITESFRTIHSSINLNDQGKLAQVILTTSTLPAEGKSFIATNLALTFAAQGQKTLIIDCDLRLPNVSRSFGFEPKFGLYDYFFGDKPLEDVIIREVAPNCDILPTERAPDNPTQVLNSVEFEELLIQCRHGYHKIIIDSPPVGAVSDALCLLPLVDGIVFVMKFNDVKKKAAKSAVDTIRESETPIFGAVMNAISAKMSNYYYSHYYDYSYHDYYYVGRPGARTSLKDGAKEKGSAESGEEDAAETSAAGSGTKKA